MMKFTACAVVAAVCNVVAAEINNHGGDIVVHLNGQKHNGYWNTLTTPKGIEAVVGTEPEATGFYATLVSSMRLPVHLVDDVQPSDYVAVEDPFLTRGADVAGLFTVLERPESPDTPRVDLDNDFKHELDALSTVQRMLSGIREDASRDISIKSMIRGETLAVAGDARFAHVLGVEPFRPSSADPAALFTEPAFTKYANKLDTKLDTNAALVRELTTALEAARTLKLSKEDKAFISIAVTKLVAIDASNYVTASALVLDVLKECSAILERRSSGFAFVEVVTLVDDSKEVEAAVRGRVRRVLQNQLEVGHVSALPHIYVNSAADVPKLCSQVRAAIEDTAYTATCTQTLGVGATDDGNPPISRVWEFQLFFWFTVLFVIGILVVSTQIAALDPGYDSIVYRMSGVGL